MTQTLHRAIAELTDQVRLPWISDDVTTIRACAEVALGDNPLLCAAALSLSQSIVIDYMQRFATVEGALKDPPTCNVVEAFSLLCSGLRRQTYLLTRSQS
jgi:hypothetical protein